MSNIQNEILVKVSADQEGSLPSLNRQIEELGKKLDGFKLDIGIDKEALKSIKQLANSDLKKISDEIKRINDQKLQVISDSEAKRAKEVMKSVFDVDFDKKKVFSSVEEIKRQLEGKGAQVKVDFTYDKEGREIINGITAISQKAGKTFSTKFKEVLVGEERGWIPSSFTQMDRTMKNTEQSIQSMKRALEDARATSKITEQDFVRLGNSLKNFANVDNDLTAFNRELKSAQQHYQQLTKAEKDHEASLHRIKQLQIDLIALGRQRPDAASRDSFINLQRTLEAEQRRLEVMKQADKLTNDSVSSTRRLAQDVSRLRAETTEVTRSQMGIFSAFQVAMERFPVWMGASTAFYGTIRSAKEFYRVVLDIDTKMTELTKVMSDDTDMGAVFDRAVESADKFAQSVSNAMDSYIEFARQGYKGEDLGYLADAGLVAANVADMTAQRASELMTASLIQWKIEAKDAMS